MKVRGIEVQRHITPGWIYETQQGMLDVFAEADDAAGFLARIPRSLLVAKKAAMELRRREIAPEELGLMVQATKDIDDYQQNTNTKFALKSLLQAGTQRNPGEYVKFVVARREGAAASRSIPVELLHKTGPFTERRGKEYHVDFYLRLLARSVETLLSPFGYTEEAVFQWLRGSSKSPKTPPRHRPLIEGPRPAYVAA